MVQAELSHQEDYLNKSYKARLSILKLSKAYPFMVAQGRSGAQEQCWGRKRSRGGAAGGAQEQARQQEAAQGVGRRWHRPGQRRRQQHLFEDVKEEGEQEREGNLGPATWAAGTRCGG
jgi:hypothetical protein